MFFSNSGTESMEAAIKFSRKRGVSISKTKTQIRSFKKGFHGRSSGSVSITEKPQYREQFGSLVSFGDDNKRFIALNDVEAFEASMSDDVCAVVLEPIQGEGGVNSATPEFLKVVRKMCDKYNALMVVDEVQCGLGRTGDLWAHTQAFPPESGMSPDLLTIAKPLAGGLAAGALICNKEGAALVAPGDHGSTFAGSPLTCAAGLYTLERVSKPEFLKGVENAGIHLRERLAAIDGISGVRGRGLMTGFDVDFASADLVAEARERGLLLHSAGPNTIRIIPPLTISLDDLDEGLDIIEGLLKVRNEK